MTLLRASRGTRLTLVNYAFMGNDAERFRIRANECRNMAAGAYDREWREALLNMANDFDEEARVIESKGIKPQLRQE